MLDQFGILNSQIKKQLSNIEKMIDDAWNSAIDNFDVRTPIAHRAIKSFSLSGERFSAFFKRITVDMNQIYDAIRIMMQMIFFISLEIKV